MNELEGHVNNVARNQLGAPKITGAYASLINSDLHDDFSQSQLPQPRNFSSADA